MLRHALVTALKKQNVAEIAGLVRSLRPEAIASLLLDVAPSVVEKLDQDATRRHRRGMYNALARQISPDVHANPDELTLWIEQGAEPTVARAYDVGQSQAVGRAAQVMASFSRALRVTYEETARGRYDERAIAWLILRGTSKAKEYCVTRAVSLDDMPTAAREAFLRAEHSISFDLIS
ncbi:MAG: hypothetical protein U0326_11915 [Polyangiales bacterium]